MFFCFLSHKSVNIHAMSLACTDFADACLNHGIGMSREDQNFMNTAEGSFIQCEEGHYQVRLPFRNQRCGLPANRSPAERRAVSLKVNSSRTPDSRKTMLHLSKT